MTQQTISRYAKENRVHMSNSSSLCPPCHVRASGYANLEELRQHHVEQLSDPVWKDIAPNLIQDLNQWETFINNQGKRLRFKKVAPA